MADLLLETGKPLNLESGLPLLLETLAQYKLLQPHYVLNAYLDAGTIVNENVQIPIGWIPTLNVDPLNTTAVNAFYAAGPRGLCWEDLNSFGAQGYVLRITPVTHWFQSSPGFFKLTGLGASLAPVAG